MNSRVLISAVVAALALSACGGEGGGAEGGDAAAGGESPPAASTAGAEGAIDAALADRGEGLFQSEGCNACHRLDSGRLVGPGLAGVTERRDREFIVAMIVNPDSMLANNETAKQLLAEYFTPMANQGVTRSEAEALYEYFRLRDSEGGN